MDDDYGPGLSLERKKRERKRGGVFYAISQGGKNHGGQLICLTQEGQSAKDN